MLRFACFLLSLIICGVMPLLASQNYLPTMLSENVDKKYAEHNKFFLKSDRSNNVIHSGDVKVGHLKFTVSKNNINYDAQNLAKKEESKSTFYYTVPVQAKSFLSRFFIGNHFSARMDTFQNAEIPFLARGSGVSTEVSTQSTNFSASYFKSNTRNSEKNSAYLSLQREKQTLAGDTKLALAIPFMSQLKLFGGYSYNRSIKSRLTKGPSFGFQADVFEHVKIDTTFIKQTVGKTAAKVLLSFNMPFERIKF